jgi:hypothetical protein
VPVRDEDEAPSPVVEITAIYLVPEAWAGAADGVADDVGPHLVQFAAVRRTRRRAVARYGLTATPTGFCCPVTRVVTGPPVSGASLIVPPRSLLAQ